MNDELAAQQVRITELEALNAQLLQALQDLYDEQNDAPLERHRDKWNAAMNQARHVIAAALHKND